MYTNIVQYKVYCTLYVYSIKCTVQYAIRSGKMARLRVTYSTVYTDKNVADFLLIFQLYSIRNCKWQFCKPPYWDSSHIQRYLQGMCHSTNCEEKSWIFTKGSFVFGRFRLKKNVFEAKTSKTQTLQLPT